MNYPVRVSLISYTNTKPFVYGLLQYPPIKNSLSLSYDTPKECARKLIEGEVDLGIVPIAAFLDISKASIVSKYCIGSNGEVNSVFVLSPLPINEIKTIVFDPQSRTSNNLVKILCRWHWHIDPEFVESKENLLDENKEEKSFAKVLIGDRTFEEKKSFAYQYDLGKAWKELTGLPFVYAVWVCNTPLDSSFLEIFNLALEFGLSNRMEIIQSIKKSENYLPGFDYKDYLFNKLDYYFDEGKREAMKRYLEFLKEL